MFSSDLLPVKFEVFGKNTKYVNISTFYVYVRSGANGNSVIVIFFVIVINSRKIYHKKSNMLTNMLTYVNIQLYIVQRNFLFRLLFGFLHSLKDHDLLFTRIYHVHSGVWKRIRLNSKGHWNGTNGVNLIYYVYMNK